MNKIQKKIERGFTLIEVLIVIGIIAILAAIVLVAVNPAKNFREAANTQRAANVNAIANAIGQYTVDQKGDLDDLDLPGNDGDVITISSGGMDDAGSGDDYNGDFDVFCDALVPEYIGALPADPGEDDQSITEDECDDSVNTRYAITVFEDDNGLTHFTISAPQTVDVDDGTTASEPISVTR